MISRYMTDEEWDDFFIKYLAVFGVKGNRYDFKEIKDWGFGWGGKYPSCFNRIWPLERMYGLVHREAFILASQIDDPKNFREAIESYRKQMIK